MSGNLRTNFKKNRKLVNNVKKAIENNKTSKLASIYNWGVVVCTIGFAVNECNKVAKTPPGKYLGVDDRLIIITEGSFALLIGMLYGIVWPATLPVALNRIFNDE